MNIRSHSLQGVLVLAPSGDLTATSGASELRRAAAAGSKVVINMSGIDHMDSSGLGELVRVAAGRSVKLCNVPSKLRSMLGSTRLAVFSDERSAAGSF